MKKRENDIVITLKFARFFNTIMLAFQKKKKLTVWDKIIMLMVYLKLGGGLLWPFRSTNSSIYLTEDLSLASEDVSLASCKHRENWTSPISTSQATSLDCLFFPALLSVLYTKPVILPIL